MGKRMAWWLALWGRSVALIPAVNVFSGCVYGADAWAPLRMVRLSPSLPRLSAALLIRKPFNCVDSSWQWF